MVTVKHAKVRIYWSAQMRCDVFLAEQSNVGLREGYEKVVSVTVDAVADF